MTRLLTTILSIAVLGCILQLPACGGAGGVGSGGTGIIASGAGTQTGNVSGFGSLIIEGNKYDDSIAVVSNEIEPSNATSASLPSVRLGMQVKASFDATERITAVTILPTVIGKVATVARSATGDSIVVAGQTVRLQSSIAPRSSPTIFEGLTGANDVIVGDKLEVHGYFDADGTVIATRVELLDDTNTTTKVSGVVSALSVTSTAQSFVIGRLNVKLSSASKILPAGNTLKAGDRVTVWAKVDAAPIIGASAALQTLDANTVRIEASNGISSGLQPWRIAGPIGAIDLNAKSITVDEVTTSFANAALKNAQLADLQLGAVVRIKGNGNSAIEIELLKTPEAVKIELAGAISDFNSPASFKVRGSLVNASAANIVFTNGGRTNLANGVLVELDGTVVNGVIVPSQITIKTVQDNRTQTIVGQVSSFNSTANTFSILGTPAKLTSSTVFKAFSGGTGSIANFVNGANVQVTGSLVQNVFNVTEVRLGNNVVQEVKIEGVATNINVTARTLILNGIAVSWTATTDINTLGKLKNGVRIEVEGLSNSANGGAIVASKIQAKDR
jgi:Domain of unknown function (DUF5666)